MSSIHTIPKEFTRIDFQKFIRGQIISLWWNSAKRNEKISSSFRSFILALIERKINEAINCRLTIKENCFLWFIFVPALLRLAILEYVHYCQMINIPMMTNSDIATASGIPENKINEIMNDLLVEKNKIIIFRKEYFNFFQFLKEEKKYLAYPIKNCAICATMGAGKSTFINAILGNSILPARCAATTAKIISVFHKNEEINNLIGGFSSRNHDRKEFYEDVTNNLIESWNNDSDISLIFLRGNLDEISNNDTTIVIHDTPGTNNSSEPLHHKITVDFLTNNKFDLIVFVLNMEHLCITDEDALLKEIYEKVVKKYNTKIIFALNKVDSIDPEIDDLDKLICNEKKYLTMLGYKNPEIYPVDAKDGKLLKMAIRGNSHQMTNMELDNFPFAVKSLIRRSDEEIKEKTVVSFDEDKIVIEENDYSKSLLCSLLYRTGLPDIEQRMKEIMK